MSKLIEMQSQYGPIIVEVETTEDEIVPVSKAGERVIKEAKEAFGKAEDVIVNSCLLMTGALKKLAEKEPMLQTASLEYGFQFTGEGNIYMVKVAAESSIKVKIDLKLAQIDS